MVWIPLKNSDGQVLKGIKLKAPKGSVVYDNEEIILSESKEYTVIGSKRMGINRYKIFLDDGTYTMNHHMRKTKNRQGWELIGRWHTPEEISILFGSKLDPDANKPRPERESFWKMKSRKWMGFHPSNPYLPIQHQSSRWKLKMALSRTR